MTSVYCKSRVGYRADAGLFISTEKKNCRALSCAAFLNVNLFNDCFTGLIHWNRVLEAVQNFIGRVLKTGVGLVQLPRRLGRKLAQFVAVVHVRESSKNQI